MPNQPWKLLVVPFDVAQVFGASGPLPVRGKINGYGFRSTLEPMRSGRHCMAVSREMQLGAHASNGASEVDVVIDLDLEPRSFQVPEQLRLALDADPRARRIFQDLPVADQRQFARWVGEPRRRETKLARAAKAAAMLKQGETL